MNDPRRTVVFSTIVKALPVILGVTAVFGAAGILLSQNQPEEFTTETRVALSATAPFDPIGNGSTNQVGRYVANQVELVGSQTVLERASTALAARPDAAVLGDTDAQSLDDALDVTAADGADVLILSTTAPTPEAAAARGSDIAFAYAETVRSLAAQSADAARTASGTDVLRVAEITVRQSVYDDGVQSIAAPPVPSEPSAPQPLRNGFLLATLGALLSIAVAVWRRGQPLAERGALVESAGAPVLGVVPVPLRRLFQRTLALPQPQDYSMALVALGYVVSNTSGVVMVSGISRDSGAPTVALGLAAAAAQQQRRVVVVDADTQGSALVRRAGQDAPEQSIGALGDPATPEGRAVGEIVDLRVAGGGSVHLAAVAGGGDGRWSADAVRAGLTRLVDTFDVVVLHAGPVSSDPVAFALLRESSVLVAVVDERSRTADLLALREKLDLAGASADGLVLTRPVPTRRRRRSSAATPPPAQPEPAAQPPSSGSEPLAGASGADRAARSPLPIGSREA